MNQSINHPNNSLSGPLDLSDEEIAEFQRLLKEETGVEYTQGEATLRARELIQLFRMMAREPQRAVNESPLSPEQKPVVQERAILDALTDLSESVALIRPRTKDWVWPVETIRRLLSATLLAVIAHQRKARHRPSDDIAVWHEGDLKDLLRRARADGVTFPRDADYVAKQITRLHNDLSVIRVETWAVLGDQIPNLIRSVLRIVGGLLWENETRLEVFSEAAQVKARELTAKTEERLLTLDVERLT